MGELYLDMGLLYDNKGDYEKTIGYYEKAVKIFMTDEQYSYNSALTYNNMGYVYIMNKDFEEAVEKLTIACRIIENISPVTNRVEEDRKDYKHNLKIAYQGLKGDISEENFEKWYQEQITKN